MPSLPLDKKAPDDAWWPDDLGTVCFLWHAMRAGHGEQSRVANTVLSLGAESGYGMFSLKLGMAKAQKSCRSQSHMSDVTMGWRRDL